MQDADESRTYAAPQQLRRISVEELPFEKAQLDRKKKQHESVDWAAYAIAMKRVYKRQHAFVVKYTYNWIPVHRRLYRQRYTTTKQCKLYGAEEEDNVHVFRCTKQ
jgi:hypothetical protein